MRAISTLFSDAAPHGGRATWSLLLDLTLLTLATLGLWSAAFAHPASLVESVGYEAQPATQTTWRWSASPSGSSAPDR